MSNNRWQFPGRMGPVLSIPRVESIKLDQWEPRVSQPVRPKRALTTAILAGALFFVPLVASAVPSLDKWAPSLQARKIVPRGTHSGFTVVDPTGLNRPIRSFDPLPDPVRPEARVNSGFTVIDPIALNLPEPSQLDKWAQPTQQPPRRAERIVESGITEFSPLPIQVTLVPGIDSWEPRLVIPPWSKQPLLRTGLQVIDPTALTLPEPAQLDKWAQPLAVPPAATAPLLQTGVIEFSPLPTPTGLDKWHRALSEPIRPRHETPLSEEFAPLVTSTLSLDSWEPRTYGPTPVRRSLPREGLTVVDPAALTTPEPTQLDKWYQALAEPRRDLNRWQWIYPVAASDQLFNVPEPADVRMICASISVAPRIAGEPSLDPRITGVPDMEPRIQGAPRLVDCE